MGDQAFIDEALRAHNEYRKKHGVAPLKHDKGISTIAQAWADKIASEDRFAHSTPNERMFEGNALGENIAMKWTSSGDPFSGQQATDNWFSEIERFDFKAGSGPQTGHFTQVVWKGSQSFGIGKAQTKGGKWFVVANYHPAGNLIGTYLDNVMPPVSGKIELPKKEDGPTMGGGGAPSGGTKTMTSTRTETSTDSSGKTIVKTIVTETTIDAAGNKTVKTSESTVEK